MRSPSLLLVLTCVGVSACRPSPAPSPIAVQSTFTANANTISTSEGAPYAFCQFWQNPSNCNSKSNFGYGPTKILQTYVCLSGEVSTADCSQQAAVTGPLSASFLADMDARFAQFENTGMRLLVRFTYNFGPSAGPAAMDAPIDVISGHLDQLAPLLLKHRDLVFALEAGFIGTWGEWHDSTNGNETAAAQKVVLDKELSYFGGVFTILVRTPGALIQYTGSSSPPAAFGLHDDQYDTEATDGATWNPCATNAGYCLTDETADQLHAYAAAVSTSTLFVAEFGLLDPPMQTCSALDAYSRTYHLQAFNLFPGQPDVATELQNEGCALSFYDKVGTRIELTRASLSGNAGPNGLLALSLTLQNTGYGRVVRARPATLVFFNGGGVVAQISIPLSALDLRTLAASATPVAQTFTFDVSLPATFPSSGQVSVALLIPDPAPSLTAQAAYALPLNSVDVNQKAIFDPTTGYNVIASLEAQR